MKKLAILFLLTTVLAAFAFAQVSIKGELELDNVAGGNGGGLQPIFKAIAGYSGTVGAFTLSGEVEFDTLFIEDAAKGLVAGHTGNANIKGGYALDVGPGSLGFYLNWAEANSRLQPGVTFSGLAAGPVTLGFEAFYQYNYDNKGGTAVFNDSKTSVFGANVSAGFDFGLNIKYEFQYGIGISEIAKIAYLDVNYKVIDPLVVGVELDDTGKEFKGLTLKPYVNYAISDAIGAGAYFKVKNINGSGDITFNPGVWIQYTL